LFGGVGGVEILRFAQDDKRKKRMTRQEEPDHEMEEPDG
jgi:hypothetical protein